MFGWDARPYRFRVTPTRLISDETMKALPRDVQSHFHDLYRKWGHRRVLEQLVKDMEAQVRAHGGPFREVVLDDHGAPGSQQMGDTSITSQDARDNPDLVQRIGRCILPGGTLTFLGCKVGRGDEGKELLESFASGMPHLGKIAASLNSTTSLLVTYTTGPQKVVYPSREAKEGKLKYAGLYAPIDCSCECGDSEERYASLPRELKFKIATIGFSCIAYAERWKRSHPESRELCRTWAHPEGGGWLSCDETQPPIEGVARAVSGSDLLSH